MPLSTDIACYVYVTSEVRLGCLAVSILYLLENNDFMYTIHTLIFQKVHTLMLRERKGAPDEGARTA